MRAAWLDPGRNSLNSIFSGFCFGKCLFFIGDKCRSGNGFVPKISPVHGRYFCNIDFVIVFVGNHKNAFSESVGCCCKLFCQFKTSQTNGNICLRFVFPVFQDYFQHAVRSIRRSHGWNFLRCFFEGNSRSVRQNPVFPLPTFEIIR
ncbi:hypothetical protein D3C71_905310 [compost metagenome]